MVTIFGVLRKGVQPHILKVICHSSFMTVNSAKVIFTDHFSGPGREIGPMCVCPNNNFEQNDL